MPPPPALALMSTGYPMRAASARACSTDSSSSLPGTVGTPASFIRRLAASLSPILEMMSPSGPMKARFCSLHSRAKAAFSDKKP